MLKLTDQRKKFPIPVRDLPEELQWLKGCTNRNYYEALWSTLVNLQPRFCLEIGTFHYYSAKIFSHYFGEYDPTGLLITVDISTWNRDKEPPTNVIPVMVYPHRSDIDKFHGQIKVHYTNYKEVLEGRPNASIINALMIHEEMERYGIDFFDFSFVDGDHTKLSMMADLQIAKNLTKPGGWILIDDVDNNEHETMQVYFELEEHNKFYTYDNWERNPGMAIIKARKFKCQ